MISVPHRTVWITFLNLKIVDPPLVRQITDRGFRNLGWLQNWREREREELGNLGRL